MLIPLLTAGPLLLASCWLLWRVLRRPDAEVNRPIQVPRIVRQLALGCFVVFGLWGLAVATFFVGERIYMRGITESSARYMRVQAVYQVIARYQEENFRPPTGMADIDPYAADEPEAIGMVRRGEVVVLWGRKVGGPSDKPVPVVHEPLDGRKTVVIYFSDGSGTRVDAATAAGLVAPE